MSDRSNDGNEGNDQHRDKKRRVRKGTRSCWECKRRKIRCIFDTESDTTCRGCLDRGTACISQEFVDDAERHSSSNSGLGHRLGRVEELLEKLMQKVSSSNEKSEPETQDDHLPSIQGLLGADVFSSNATPRPQYDNAPIMSLFDNCLFTQPPHQHEPRQMPTPGPVSSVSSPEISSKLDIIRRTLVRLLPSQADCDLLLGCGSCGWWFLRKHVLPDFGPDNNTTPKALSVDFVRMSHPCAIARLLLALCLAIQQIPAEFDTESLQMQPTPAVWMDKCMTTVASLVTSDDELVGTVEGLECLILAGVFQINLGNLRRAWLTFRRALNVAQLMGLHRFPASKIKHSLTAPSCTDDLHRSFVYFQIVKGDIYLTLLLGLPSALEKEPFSTQPHDAYNRFSTEESYNKSLSVIALRVIKRNSAVESNTYAETQQIDEELELLKRSMPPEWWTLPEDLEFRNAKSDETAKTMDRMLCQLWHFQIESLVHLPFMLRSATERRYEYSKFCCLNASRDLIRRWMVLRRGDKSFVCHIVDFQAFMAAITILLGLMGPPGESTQQAGQHESDRRLVDALIKNLEGFDMEPRNAVALQCVEVLKTLMCTELHTYTGNLRLTIPYFGTLSLVSGLSVEKADGNGAVQGCPGDFDGVAPQPQIWQGLGDVGQVGMQQPVMQQPVLSFESSQFPGMEDWAGGGTEWQFGPADIRVFDSLVNTDIEGNWGFGAL